MLQQNSGLIERCWVRFLVLRVGRIGGGGAVGGAENHWRCGTAERVDD